MDNLHAKQASDARVRLASGKPDEDRAFDMATIAKYAFNQGNLAEARKYGTLMLDLAAKSTDKTSGDYGVAVHDGHVVMGRIALREKDVAAAKKHLIEAGKTPGAPTLDSFGPNMELANDLLAVGERETVLEYFKECEKFWSYHLDKLHEWSTDVKSGNTPNFGANLDY